MMYTTHNEQETKKVAEAFAQTLHGGEIIFLNGELGSGKTTFVRGVAEALGFTDHVRSPTFTLVHRYPIKHPSIKQILHVDFYRIDDPSEIPPLALEEELGSPDTVAFIEWPERVVNVFSPTHRIEFTVGESQHEIHIILQPHAVPPRPS